MKRGTLFLCLAILFTTAVQAQYIKNKLNISIGYTQLLPEKESLVVENEFSSPSLFNNMNTRLSFSMKATYKIFPYLSLGFGTDRGTYKNWTYKAYLHYSGSKVTEKAIYPIAELHMKQATRGFFNVVRPNLQLSPMFGQLEVSFSHSPIEVHSPLSIPKEAITSVTDSFKGIKASIGIDVILHQNMGLSAAYGMKKSQLSSSFFPDTSLKQHFLEVGLFFRFDKNKRFYL